MMTDNLNKPKKMLFSAQKIQQRVVELGAQITKDYQGKKLVTIGVLNGSVLFFSDIVRVIDLEMEFDFIRLKSYSGTSSTGTVRLEQDIHADIAGRDILIIEDIVDTGRSLEFLIKRLEGSFAKSVRICTLLYKKEKASKNVIPDYVGFEIPDDFVVGYGLDYNQKYRNLDSIYRLR
ncbi:hypoxanthine phosphoribosyltransferase [bacterium]|nr:hypoxanthine phosphoribosyltransferase [bacterium]